MKYSLCIVLIILLFPFTGEAQDGVLLSKIFTTADSIRIVSHEDLTYGNASNKWATIQREIYKDGKPNYTIVKEIVTLKKEEFGMLHALLIEGKPDEDQVGGFCIFNPHHAIFIYKNGNCSCISFCFECRMYIISEGLKTGEPVFINYCTWKNLYDFFVAHGIKYKMMPKYRC